MVFAFVPFLTSGDTILFTLVCLLTGLSLGSDMALPAAMQADVLERERSLYREDSGGWYFGLWGMITKLAMALGVGLALPLVDWAGFDPNQINTATALTGVALAYGWLPLPFKLAAVWLVWRFPLDQHSIARLRRTTDDRNSTLPTVGHPHLPPAGQLQHHEA
jgi:Na+/melibiose symporter-like transporter